MNVILGDEMTGRVRHRVRRLSVVSGKNAEVVDGVRLPGTLSTLSLLLVCGETETRTHLDLDVELDRQRVGDCGSCFASQDRREVVIAGGARIFRHNDHAYVGTNGNCDRCGGHMYSHLVADIPSHPFESAGERYPELCGVCLCLKGLSSHTVLPDVGGLRVGQSAIEEAVALAVNLGADRFTARGLALNLGMKEEAFECWAYSRWTEKKPPLSVTTTGLRLAWDGRNLLVTARGGKQIVIERADIVDFLDAAAAFVELTTLRQIVKP